MSQPDKLGTASQQVSPDYRAKCLEWALKLHNPDTAANIIVQSAKAFHAFVYEGK